MKREEGDSRGWGGVVRDSMLCGVRSVRIRHDPTVSHTRDTFRSCSHITSIMTVHWGMGEIGAGRAVTKNEAFVLGGAVMHTCLKTAAPSTTIRRFRMVCVVTVDVDEEMGEVEAEAEVEEEVVEDCDLHSATSPDPVMSKLTRTSACTPCSCWRNASKATTAILKGFVVYTVPVLTLSPAASSPSIDWPRNKLEGGDNGVVAEAGAVGIIEGDVESVQVPPTVSISHSGEVVDDDDDDEEGVSLLSAVISSM